MEGPLGKYRTGSQLVHCFAKIPLRQMGISLRYLRRTIPNNAAGVLSGIPGTPRKRASPCLRS